MPLSQVTWSVDRWLCLLVCFCLFLRGRELQRDQEEKNKQTKKRCKKDSSSSPEDFPLHFDGQWDHLLHSVNTDKVLTLTRVLCWVQWVIET